MKTFLQILFFSLLVTQISFAQWEQIGFSGKMIMDLTAQDSTIFAITQGNGEVYRSFNNGITWDIIVDSNAVDIALRPSGEVFMVKSDSFYMSTNYGSDWIKISIPLDSVYQLPVKTYIGPNGTVFYHFRAVTGAGSCSRIAKLKENGQWVLPNIIAGGTVLGFNNEFILTIGGCGTWGGGGQWTYLSTDTGETWQELPQSRSNRQIALGLFSNLNIITAGPDWSDGTQWLESYTYLSTDMCSTWTIIDTLPDVQAGVSYRTGSSERMLIGTKLGLFLYSDNGIKLGSPNEGLTNLNIKELIKDNYDYLYAGTGDGIWRRHISDILSSNEEQNKIPKEFSILQNYPNPFNPSTSIKYSVSEQMQVVLKIFDALGREVKTLVHEEKPAGSYEAT